MSRDWPLPRMVRGRVLSRVAEPTVQPLSFQLESALAPLRGLDLADKTVAVAVGSRGIANIDTIVRATCSALASTGAKPFLIPAMGSHGGGTAAGQEGVLKDLGLDPVQTGIPVRSSLETVEVGQTADGISVYVDAHAMAADAIYVVGRVKPHTSFTGRLQSGLVKLLVVGAGKVDGARAFHRATTRRPHSDVLHDMFEVVAGKTPLLGGLAIIENEHHETAHLEHVPVAAVLEREPQLLTKATSLMPSLPVADLDVLVIDEIGKDTSGAGMDPNITGRRFAVNARWQEDRPRVTRIVALALTPASHGNAAGVGLADFVGPRLLADMDPRPTYLNAITSLNTIHAHIPLHFSSDQETLYYAIRSVGLDDSEVDNVRLLHIRNTLSLTHFEASAAVAEDLADRNDIELASQYESWQIDSEGNIAPLVDAEAPSPCEGS